MRIIKDYEPRMLCHRTSAVFNNMFYSELHDVDEFPNFRELALEAFRALERRSKKPWYTRDRLKAKRG